MENHLDGLLGGNAGRSDWVSRAGRQDRAFVSGTRERTADLRVSRTDPDATPMRVGAGETRLGYQAHYVVDGGKARIVLNALVAPAEVSENRPMLDLLWRTVFRWKLRPRRVVADGIYGTVENLAAVEKAGVRGARHCATGAPGKPNGPGATRRRQKSATLARSSRNAPQTRRGARSCATSTRNTSTG